MSAIQIKTHTISHGKAAGAAATLLLLPRSPLEGAAPAAAPAPPGAPTDKEAPAHARPGRPSARKHSDIPVAEELSDVGFTCSPIDQPRHLRGITSPSLRMEIHILYAWFSKQQNPQYSCIPPPAPFPFIFRQEEWLTD